MKIHRPSRRDLLRYGIGAALLAACGNGARGTAHKDARSPTPEVIDDDDVPPPDTACGAVTAKNIEGPYYTAGAPDKDTFVSASDGGERLVLGGLVLGASGCAPLRDVELDIWHADAAGGYDNRGYHLRGKVHTDADGRWQVSTIIPGRYLNGDQYRPAHIHFKVRAAGHRELTTQLYFDGDPYNDVDPFIHRSLIMPVDKASAGSRCNFDFVLAEIG